MKIIVNTGFGVIRDNKGDAVSYAELPKGEHNLTEGFTYQEFADRTSMQAVALKVQALSEEQLLAQKINEEIQAIAVASLTQKGIIVDGKVV